MENNNTTNSMETTETTVTDSFGQAQTFAAIQDSSFAWALYDKTAFTAATTSPSGAQSHFLRKDPQAQAIVSLHHRPPQKQKKEKSYSKMPRRSRDEGVGKYPYPPDFENNVIQKQRRELQQLVTELRDRDRELNDVVAGHQRQIAGWEVDRRRLQQMEERIKVMEGQLLERQNQIQGLSERYQTLEKKFQEKSDNFHQLKNKNEKLQRQHEHQKRLIEELEEHSEQLERKVNELSMNADLFNSQQHDIIAELRKKENDLFQRTQECQELISRVKLAENHVKSQEHSLKQYASKCQELSVQMEHQTQSNSALKDELKQTKAEANSYYDNKEKLISEVTKLRKENQLMTERERRKDEVIQSHRLRQERNETEISHLRQLYERMQKQLSQLQAVDDVHCDDDTNDNTYLNSCQFNGNSQSLSNFAMSQENKSVLFGRLGSFLHRPLAYPTNASSTNNKMSTFLASQSSAAGNHDVAPARSSGGGLLARVNSSPDLTKSGLYMEAAADGNESNFLLSTSRNITEKYNRILSELN